MNTPPSPCNQCLTRSLPMFDKTAHSPRAPQALEVTDASTAVLLSGPSWPNPAQSLPGNPSVVTSAMSIDSRNSSSFVASAVGVHANLGAAVLNAAEPNREDYPDSDGHFGNPDTDLGIILDK